MADFLALHTAKCQTSPAFFVLPSVFLCLFPHVFPLNTAGQAAAGQDEGKWADKHGSIIHQFTPIMDTAPFFKCTNELLKLCCDERHH